ncbi:MAG: HNH endonuclease [Candidatus Eremiobacteraeota bacterium]|nr:HNH endonuclease [Candidatus Eremiobacteraeota bacterium]
MNPKKVRGWCTNDCGNKIKPGATKYCSLRCQHQHHYRLRIRILESGAYKVPSGQSPFIRRYLIRQLGEQCFRCGWAKRNVITGKVPVEVEHIDGNSQNNRLDNLTLLCPNCHALTSTFRALNRGRGRAYRLGGRSNPLAGATSSLGSPSRRSAASLFEQVKTAPVGQLTMF